MAFLQAFLSTFHIGSATGWDIFIIFLFLIGVWVYGFFLGRNRMIVLLLGSYFSWAITQTLPWVRLTSVTWLGLGESPSPSLKMLVFLGLVLLFYFLIPRSILSSPLRIKKRGEAGWLQLLLLSVVQLGFVVSVLVSFLPDDIIATLTPMIKKIFVGGDARFVWIFLPILTVVLMRRQKKAED